MDSTRITPACERSVPFRRGFTVSFAFWLCFLAISVGCTVSSLFCADYWRVVLSIFFVLWSVIRLWDLLHWYSRHKGEWADGAGARGLTTERQRQEIVGWRKYVFMDITKQCGHCNDLSRLRLEFGIFLLFWLGLLFGLVPLGISHLSDSDYVGIILTILALLIGSMTVLGFVQAYYHRKKELAHEARAR